MGVSNYLDIFQHKTNDLFKGIELIFACKDNLLVLIKGDRKYYVEKLELTIWKWKKVGLNVILKVFLWKKWYGLGSWVTHEGVRTLTHFFE